MRIVYVWRYGVPNVGDFYSSPYHYKPLALPTEAGDQVSTVEYRAFQSGLPALPRIHDEVADVIVVGGGVCRGVLNKRRDLGPLVIGWGVGTSVHGSKQTKFDYGSELTGVRDFPHRRGYMHVPCASCFMPGLDEGPRFDLIKHDAVLFLNNDKGSLRHAPDPRQVEGLPVANNHWPLPDVLAFLRSGATVVTNSYHGAYWGQLLGRKVVQINAYSSKFHGFKSPVAIAEPGERWDSAAKRYREADDPLTYARTQNRKFHARVVDAINDRR